MHHTLTLPMKKLVFDIETKNTFRDIGKKDPAGLDISLLVVYDYDTDSYQSFLEEDFSRLWKLLEQADMLIGYNSNHFDIPLLNKYYPGDLTKIKSLDLLAEIHNALGKRLRLDDIASATLGKNKSASGLEAIEWWKNGEIDKIRDYCEQDVRVTKEIYDYALANSSLKYKDLNDIKEFPINTSRWEEKEEKEAMNFTLPF